LPTIYDNIENVLAEGLRRVLPGANAADFCIGYFNLRGWVNIADLVDQHLDGQDGRRVRLLVGMSRPPEEEMRLAQSAIKRDERLDGPTAARLKQQATASFKEQIEFGLPTADAERTLRQLARQLRQGQLQVKLFLRYPLHAKLYLVHRRDRVAPLVGYVGSSNLTLAGLSRQGELNVDVLEQDAAQKLQRWFDERWQDTWALDISEELADLIESSWAGERLIPPYLVYLKMVYHLSQEARRGESEFRLPAAFRGVLLPFQERAVSLAAHCLNRRGGVLLADVVGLGKTMMATAIAKVFEEDLAYNTLVICPPRLAGMWHDYIRRYSLRAEVLSLGRVSQVLPDLPRFRLVIIDESHMLRNREGERYRAIHEYIQRNDSRCLLLTATPYNKEYADLSNQLRLFLDDQEDLGIRPEAFFRAWQASGLNEADFRARFQASPRSLRAFERSQDQDDWRNLLRLYMVRRTRRFILDNYASFDEVRQRYYIALDERRFYFPQRQPHTLTFDVREGDPGDQYARLYQDQVVQAIAELALPRYGLANYLKPDCAGTASAEERRLLADLNRAGRRLIGYVRTNLFKRLESSGHSFLRSLRRHVLRNLIALHALENGLPLPIGTQDAALLDSALSDADTDLPVDNGEGPAPVEDIEERLPADMAAFMAQAARAYEEYRGAYATRFQWLSPRFFTPELAAALRSDAEALLGVLKAAGTWSADEDTKLAVLCSLLKQRHAGEKVLVFTQFADTAEYLGRQLQARGCERLAVVIGESKDPTALARRFSPVSNGGLHQGETQLQTLIATDVLADGQNLQDCAVIVNYDLPWAIVRIIQRAGRVDRIGQKHDSIHVYSFLPTEGIEQVIRLRRRLNQRLQQNQEVIGSDESFFGEAAEAYLRDLYTEKTSALEADEGEDVDLSSVALHVWNSAPESARRQAAALPPVVYATKSHTAGPDNPDGVLAYIAFPDRTDTLVRVDSSGQVISQSLSAIFRLAACPPETPALPRRSDHHELVAKAVRQAIADEANLGGQLGSLRSVRRRVFELLRAYRGTASTGQNVAELDRLLDLLHRYPLLDGARERLNRQLRLGLEPEAIFELVQQLAAGEQLVRITAEPPIQEPLIICSLGLSGTMAAGRLPETQRHADTGG